MMESLGFLFRLVVIVLVSIASGAWLYFLASRTAVGLKRWLACLPIVAINLWLQSLLDPKKEFITKGIVLVTLVWAANFKVLALCLGRGTLCQPLSRQHFILTYALPITPQQQGVPKTKTNSQLHKTMGTQKAIAKAFLGKLALEIVLVLVLSQYGNKFPPLLLEFLQGFLLYVFLGTMMDINAALIMYFASLPISPHFDSPFLSASIGEFWSKRWNLTIGNTLRMLIYDPIHEGRLVADKEPFKKNLTRSALAMCSSFFVSGLMHWAIYRLLHEEHSGALWLIFFAVQGPILIGEGIVYRILRKKRILPPVWIRIPITLYILLCTAHAFLFPPIADAKLDGLFYDSFLRVLQGKSALNP